MLRTTSPIRAALTAALVLLATAVPARSAHAQTATLNFDTFSDASLGTLTVPNSYTESGYVVTAVADPATDPLSFATFGSGDASYTGSSALLLNSATASDVDFMRTGGGLFSFQSVDLAPFMSGDTTSVMFTGFGPGSSSIFQKFLVTESGPQTFFLDNFTGLTSVRMTALNQYDEPYVQFDNVAFSGQESTVPEPATFGLVAMGLMGMGGTLRRRRRS